MDNIKTVIYCETGYYGSSKLWRDAAYAFRHRNDIPYHPYGTLAYKPPMNDWMWLGNDSARVAQLLNVPIDILPEYDYEYVTMEK